MISASDIRSTLSKNCLNISEEFKIDPWIDNSRKMKISYSFHKVPFSDTWRMSLLDSLLKNHFEMDAIGEDTGTVNGLISSLCVS